MKRILFLLLGTLVAALNRERREIDAKIDAFEEAPTGAAGKPQPEYW